MKRFYLSKTFWVNIIALVVLLAETELGFGIGPEEKVGLLAVINLVLRFVTKQSIE